LTFFECEKFDIEKGIVCFLKKQPFVKSLRTTLGLAYAAPVTDLNTVTKEGH
jgi:hypothetical protein